MHGAGEELTVEGVRERKPHYLSSNTNLNPYYPNPNPNPYPYPYPKPYPGHDRWYCRNNHDRSIIVILTRILPELQAQSYPCLTYKLGLG